MSAAPQRLPCKNISKECVDDITDVSSLTIALMGMSRTNTSEHIVRAYFHKV